MADPVFMDDVAYYYFTCDRNPTHDEPIVDAAAIPADMFYFWLNTTTTRVFLPKIRTPEEKTWSKILTTDDLAPLPDPEVLPNSMEVEKKQPVLKTVKKNTKRIKK